MNVYEVVFAQNEVVSCNIEFGDVTFKGMYSYEHHNGQLKYALVKGISHEHAMNMTNQIIREVSENAIIK